MAATDRKTATEWLKDSGRMLRYDETKLIVREYQVTCRTLNSYQLLDPVLIKLHAQGAEPDILQGALQTIKQHRPAVMCAFISPGISRGSSLISGISRLSIRVLASRQGSRNGR